MNSIIASETVESITAEAEENIGLFHEFLEQLGPKALNLGLQLLFVLIVFAIGIKLISFLRKIIRKSMERANMEAGLAQFLDSLIKYLLYFVLIMIILGFFGVQATSIFAIAGSAGLTLGLALQGSLSNFAGGVLILVLKPFSVGDYIIEDTYKNEGTVQKIQLFYTTLVTYDHKQITVPNATLANTSLTNVTGSGERMLAVKVSVSYESDIKLAKELMLDVLRQEPDVIKEEEEKEIKAFVSDLADSGIVMEARAWVPADCYFPVKWSVLEKIKYAFDENGISIPYPQMDVHVDSLHSETIQH